MFHDTFASPIYLEPTNWTQILAHHSGLSVPVPHDANSLVIPRGFTVMTCVPSRSHL